MPIYSYRCSKCGETFDKLVKPGSNDIVPCAHCQAETKRVFSPVGIIFKGSGFYSTDYKSGNSSPANNDSAKTEKDNKKEDQQAKATDAGTKEKAAEQTKPSK